MEPGRPKDVPGELQVLVVVIDDEHERHIGGPSAAR
jgi:hypothetical protein